MRKGYIWSVVVMGVALLGIGVYLFSGWSKINCWTEEIDINSGETRYKRYWFWIMTKDEISPTWMSKALNVRDKESSRDWHLVVTLSPGTGHSPHYAYHSATGCLNLAESLFQEYDVPHKRKTALAEAIRDSWKRTGGDDEAGELVTDFWEEVSGEKVRSQ